jgi:hypothetical protein
MNHTVKNIKAFLFAILLVLVATNSQGASLSYSPTSMDITQAAGSEGTVPYTVTVQSGIGSYYLWFINSIGSGNLPIAWLSVSPSTTFLSDLTPSGSTTLKVKVPDGTAPGVYSGTLLSKAMPAHGVASPGFGIFIQVTVPVGCDQPPFFEITSFGPEILWQPNHKMQEVSISGRVILKEGCSLLEAGYNIDDEYGIYTSMGLLTVASDGSFTAYLLLEASRYGKDKDGRHYTITLYAQDEAGIGTSAPLVFLVPHDKGHDNKDK